MPGLLLKAQLKLPRLCSDGMVLQSRMPVPVWGWAAVGSTVTLAFMGHNYKVRAGRDGRWQVQLPAAAPGGPYVMQVRSGRQQLNLRDILVGEVWVCSGQSNMEHDLTSVIEKYPSLLAEGNYPRIRQFKVPDRFNFKHPETDFDKGGWLPGTHENLGAFTAVGFFFARQLQQNTGEAVGIINITLGGSPIEAWLPESVLRKYPRDNARLQQFKNDSLVAAVQKSDQAKSAAWEKSLNQSDQGETEGWRELTINSTIVRQWPSMSVPGYWADQGLGQMNGVVWLKKQVVLNTADAAAEKTAKLVLGRMVDADSVFVNGHYAGNTTYQYPRRRYVFPAGLLHKGENTITVRLENQSGKGGFVPDKVYALVRGTDTISLAGRWKFQAGASAPKAPSQTFVRWTSGGLFNGMLAPAFSYGIKGFIWYQGESNADNAPEYASKLKDLLATVRNGWGNSSLPFLVVQLPNFMQQDWDPNARSGWARIRQQQTRILEAQNTDMAVTVGLGEWNDVHPLDKEPVGQRLYLLAEDMCYAGPDHTGHLIDPAHHSPVAVKAVSQADSVYITFNYPQPLRIRPGDRQLKHFALAGADGKFYWAEAGIRKNGTEVWVYSADVPSPKQVRYGWSDNPLRANLENEAGLPASPFEMDVAH